jgi:hypothetical protein
VPPDAGTHDRGVASSLDLHNFCEICSKRRGDEPASFGQNLVEIVVIEHKVSEVGKRPLAVIAVRVIAHRALLLA